MDWKWLVSEYGRGRLGAIAGSSICGVAFAVSYHVDPTFLNGEAVPEITVSQKAIDCLGIGWFT
ncbi:hypothetical protein L209DRAFT_751413 [Thermothelomyces heterothallicus CBS 203.75]